MIPNSNLEVDARLLPAYFAEAAACFERAAVRAGRKAITYRVGAHSFALEFAGPALEPRMAPAFAHLANNANGDFRIFLWDSKSTGVAMPAPPWKWGAFLRNEIYIGDRIKIVYSGDSGSLVMYDADARQAIFWVRESGHIPIYVTGAPLLPAMHWWLESNGCQLAHAGAVGGPEGGVLLVGRGGSGKSTAALACLTGGLEYAADDYCVLDATDPARVYSLYCSAKLAADSRSRLPGLEAAVYNPPAAAADKTLYFVNRIFPDRISHGFPLRAVLLARISGTNATKLSPVSPASALRALAPSTIFQLSGAGGTAFRTLASVIRRTPCFEIASGSDLSGIAEAVAALLKQNMLARPGGLTDE